MCIWGVSKFDLMDGLLDFLTQRHISLREGMAYPHVLLLLCPSSNKYARDILG